MAQQRAALACLPLVFYLMLAFSQTAESAPVEGGASDATGERFSGAPFRTFNGPRRLQQVTEAAATGTLPPPVPEGCQRWAVVTTIFAPSEAVRRASRMGGWCLVVVADTSSLAKYDLGWWYNDGSWAARVVYLTPADQRAMGSAFIDALPWRSFARKNVGYLYAVQQGARLVWDFDDDNEQIFFAPGHETLRDGPVLNNWLPGTAPSGSGDTARAYPAVEVERAAPFPTFNPYPGLGGPAGSWPRGFPLTHITDPRSYTYTPKPVVLPAHEVGVLQSLAQHQPDMDAIYRLTRETPFSFRRQPTPRPILVPSGSMTPFNAQATLHNYPALWALYLPCTVPGRVSDIWRSYIAQRLFRDVHLRLGFFARPLVVQDRNAHDYLRDFNAEGRLYAQTEALIAFLTDEWHSEAPTLPARIEDLWIALYERGYVEARDVEYVQLWLRALLNSGYQFPGFDREANARAAAARTAARTVGTSGSPHPPRPPTAVPLPPPPSDEVRCDSAHPLRLWAMDLHDGTRMDPPTVVSEMGGYVTVAGHKRTHQPHPELINPLVGEHLVYNDGGLLSNTIARGYLTHTTPLTHNMLQENFDFYSRNPTFQRHNAVVCSFPASMCELFLALNRTIVYAPAHRYNLGRCTADAWRQLDLHLANMAASHPPQPRHVIAALSHYDARYLRYYTGLEPLLLESSSRAYLKTLRWTGTKDEILYAGHQAIPGVDATGIHLRNPSDLYGHWRAAQLIDHRALVYLPYSVMSYKLTEYYAMGIPLFVPSLHFFNTENEFGRDRTSTTPPYCNAPELATRPKHPDATDPYSPNTERATDPEAELYWLQFSDFMTWPHITYFDNATHLKAQLQRRLPHVHDIHAHMAYTNALRFRTTKENWCEGVFKKVGPPGSMPPTLEAGLAPYGKPDG